VSDVHVVVPPLTPENYNLSAGYWIGAVVVVPLLTPENYNW